MALSLEKIISEMKQEMERNISSLRMPYNRHILPMYISYCFTNSEEIIVIGDMGSSRSQVGDGAILETELRVKRKGVDVTGCGYEFSGFYPEPEEDSMRIALWRQTDDAFKSAVLDYLEKKKSKLLIPGQKKRKNAKFLCSGPQRRRESRKDLGVDREGWERTISECTAMLAGSRHVTDSRMEFTAGGSLQCFVNSEGSELITSSRQYIIDISASAITGGKNHKVAGDTVQVNRQMYYCHPDNLPSREELLETTKVMMAELGGLMRAPIQESLDRPAILDAELNSQLIYSILAGSVLNRCSFIPLADMNQVKKGDKVLPEFISVYDDPQKKVFTSREGGKKHLNGHALFDEQGIPCERIDMIKDGKIDTFPSSREYKEGTNEPNGHGRSGYSSIVPGVTNMFIVSKEMRAQPDLQERLIEECEREGYDYGFWMQGAVSSEIDQEENYYKMTPRLVYRVWAKDAVDKDTGKSFKRGDMQLVRGVELVGNPDMTLSGMRSTGNDYEAVVPTEVESIPGLYQGGDISVIGPSALYSHVELKKDFRGKTRPALIPHPLYDKKGGKR